MATLNTGSMAAYHQLPRQKTWCWGPLHLVRSLLLLLPTHVNLTHRKLIFTRVIVLGPLCHIFWPSFQGFPCWVKERARLTSNFNVSVELRECQNIFQFCKTSSFLNDMDILSFLSKRVQAAKAERERNQGFTARKRRLSSWWRILHQHRPPPNSLAQPPQICRNAQMHLNVLV